jgi:hypothetical protein
MKEKILKIEKKKDRSDSSELIFSTISSNDTCFSSENLGLSSQLLTIRSPAGTELRLSGQKPCAA